MDLSIVIVSWNTVDMLRDCLASVVEAPNNIQLEIFVVDNASEDGSQYMVKDEFPQVQVIENETNDGFAAGNNRALRVCTGEFVLLLNSDTLIHENVLDACHEFMQLTAKAGAMGCRVLNTDGSPQISCSNYPSLTNLFLLTIGTTHFSWLKRIDQYQMRYWNRTNTQQVDVISGCYMFIRRSALNQVGLLDESFFFFAEETDWCKRLKSLGWQVWYAPVGKITHHGGGSSQNLSYRRDLMLSNGHVRLHKKHGGVLAALMCWVILFMFNLSRAIFWSTRSLWSQRQCVKQRARHFRSIVADFRSAWPSTPGTSI